MIADAINGCMAGGGAMLLLMNIYCVLRDQSVRGVHWLPNLYFTAWNAWSVYFMYGLDQWWSFYGFLAMAAVQGLWLTLIMFYWRRS